MRKLILACCVLLALVSGANGQGLTPVKGTRVGLVLPDGFKPAARFTGFLSDGHSASIVVTELPAPVSETAKGFTKDDLGQKGMSLLSREAASFGVLEGTISSVSQKVQDRVFLKWTGLFGDTQTTFMVVATFPATSDKNLSAVLKGAVASARVVAASSNPADALTFGVTPASSLVVSKIMGNNMVLTESGAFPVKNLDGPLMAIGASASQGLKVSARRDFALERLKKTATLSDISAESTKEITVDGLAGYEIIGQAIHRASGKKASIYQVVLFEETDYYIMQGFVSEQDKVDHLAAFKKTATSFKRKIVKSGTFAPGDQPLRSP